MPLSFPTSGCLKIVGRTPWTHSPLEESSTSGKAGQGADRGPGGPPHNLPSVRSLENQAIEHSCRQPAFKRGFTLQETSLPEAGSPPQWAAPPRVIHYRGGT